MNNDTNTTIINNNREMNFLVNIQSVLESYSCILKRYLELTNNKVNRRFLNNRPWLYRNYDFTEDILSYIKMPYEIFNQELVDYAKGLAENVDDIEKSTLIKRISALESKIISSAKIESSRKKSNVSSLSIISSVEMENVRGTMQSLKDSNVDLIVEENMIEGHKYFIAAENELTNSIISKNRDSQIKVSIKRQLGHLETVDDSSKQLAVQELKDSLLNLNANVDMMWVILCDNFIKQLDNGTLTELGEATLTFDEIHFKFRGKAGKNSGSTIPHSTIENYIKLVKMLSSFKANIKLNTKSMKAYYNFSKNSIFKDNNSYSIDSNIINSNFIYEDFVNKNGLLEQRIVGLRYNLDLLGKLYLTETKMINSNVPTTMLEYDTNKLSPAYNILVKIIFLANSNNKDKYTSAKFTLTELIEIAHYKFDERRKSLYIKRFLKSQVKKALDDAVKDKLIRAYDIPREEDLNMKYLDANIITIYY